MVTTAITAVTPTTIPISVSEVRSLFERRLEEATRNASQIAVSRNVGKEGIRFGNRSANIRRRGDLSPGELAGRDVVLSAGLMRAKADQSKVLSESSGRFR